MGSVEAMAAGVEVGKAVCSDNETALTFATGVSLGQLMIFVVVWLLWSQDTIVLVASGFDLFIFLSTTALRMR